MKSTQTVTRRILYIILGLVITAMLSLGMVCLHVGAEAAQVDVADADALSAVINDLNSGAYAGNGDSVEVTLTDNITLTEALPTLTSGTLTIHGGEYWISTNNGAFPMIQLENSATLTWVDGTIKDSGASSDDQRVIILRNSSTFNLLGGTITDCKGVLHMQDASNFNMSGGLITKCAPGKYAAVWIQGKDCRIHMTGGEFSDFSGDFGGAFYFHSGGNSHITGPVGTASIHVSGTARFTNLEKKSKERGSVIASLFFNPGLAIDIDGAVFDRCKVSGNGEKAGVIYIGTSKVTMTINNAQFIANSAVMSAYYGGAIYIDNLTSGNTSTFTITNTSFDGFYVGSTGGAVEIECKDTFTFTADNCTFRNCRASRNGGAVYIGSYIQTGSTVRFTNCEFEACTAGGAGAIYDDVTTAASVQIEDCTFTNNSATSEGAALYVNQHTLTISECTITSTGTKPPLYTYRGTLIAENCTITTPDGVAPMAAGQTGKVSLRNTVKNEEELRAVITRMNAGGRDEVVLVSDIALTAPLEMTAGQLKIKGEGHTLSIASGHVFALSGTAALTLEDSMTLSSSQAYVADTSSANALVATAGEATVDVSGCTMKGDNGLVYGAGNSTTSLTRTEVSGQRPQYSYIDAAVITIDGNVYRGDVTASTAEELAAAVAMAADGGYVNVELTTDITVTESLKATSGTLNILAEDHTIRMTGDAPLFDLSGNADIRVSSGATVQASTRYALSDTAAVTLGGLRYSAENFVGAGESSKIEAAIKSLNNKTEISIVLILTDDIVAPRTGFTMQRAGELTIIGNGHSIARDPTDTSTSATFYLAFNSPGALYLGAPDATEAENSLYISAPKAGAVYFGGSAGYFYAYGTTIQDCGSDAIRMNINRDYIDQTGITLANCVIDTTTGNGIYTTYGRVVANDCVIRNCEKLGIDNEAGEVFFTNCLIENCVKGGYEGRYGYWGPAPGTFVNCEIRYCQGTGMISGGGNLGTILTVIGGSVHDCTKEMPYSSSTMFTGGIYAQGCMIDGTEVYNCRVLDSLGTNNYRATGGIACEWSSTIKNVKIHGNSIPECVTTGSPGISVTNNGSDEYVDIINCEVYGNRGINGGAVYVYAYGGIDSSCTTISGGQFYGNKAVDGGAIHVGRYGIVVVKDGAKIYGNEATGNGGGICVDSYALPSEKQAGKVTLNDVMVYDNYAENCGGGVFATNRGKAYINAGAVIFGNGVPADKQGADIALVNGTGTLNVMPSQYAESVTLDGKPLTNWYYDDADRDWHQETSEPYTTMGSLGSIYLIAAYSTVEGPETVTHTMPGRILNSLTALDTGRDITVAADGAATVYWYTDRSSPSWQLIASAPLPVGTCLTLIDWNVDWTDVTRVWYYIVNEETDTVELRDFRLMGSSDRPFTPAVGALACQLCVVFPGTQSYNAVTLGLKQAPEDEDALVDVAVTFEGALATPSGELALGIPTVTDTSVSVTAAVSSLTSLTVTASPEVHTESEELIYLPVLAVRLFDTTGASTAYPAGATVTIGGHAASILHDTAYVGIDGNGDFGIVVTGVNTGACMLEVYLCAATPDDRLGVHAVEKPFGHLLARGTVCGSGMPYAVMASLVGGDDGRVFAQDIIGSGRDLVFDVWYPADVTAADLSVEVFRKTEGHYVAVAAPWTYSVEAVSNGRARMTVTVPAGTTADGNGTSYRITFTAGRATYNYVIIVTPVEE